MMQQIFDLQSFPGSNVPTGVCVTVLLARESNLLSVRYSLKNSASLVAIPPRVDPPQRKNNLWEETCFEIFLSPKNMASYWEFNFSPSRHWNVYHFDSYRQGMKEESAISRLSIDVNRAGDSLWLQARIPLRKIGLGNSQIQVGITTVVKTKNDEVSYWALAHCGKQPDFHLRESFAIDG